MFRSSGYPGRFRKDAVVLVRASDRPLRRVARELGVNHEILRSWVKATGQAQATPSNASSAADRDGLRTLCKRVAELELEKDILRKAAAYFAQEMGC
ncbi:MAG: transposase [Actinomycetota bacterium]|nr:transposase [Actinomycetota bacterium]